MISSSITRFLQAFRPTTAYAVQFVLCKAAQRAVRSLTDAPAAPNGSYQSVNQRMHPLQTAEKIGGELSTGQSVVL